MLKKKYAFAINSYYKAIETILSCKNKKIFPIIYIKFFIVDGFGPDWINELNNLLQNKFSKNSYELYVDCKKNYGLFIDLVEQKISYLKVKADDETFRRLNEIAMKNKVSLNPSFSVVDLFKINKINKKIEKIQI